MAAGTGRRFHQCASETVDPSSIAVIPTDQAHAARRAAPLLLTLSLFSFCSALVNAMPTHSSHPESQATPTGARGIVARGFRVIEDVVYVGLGVLLSVSALTLLGSTAIAFARGVADGSVPQDIVSLLDNLLLVLMVVELLYTVKVSFREHAVLPEPFLIVGLVAVVRRILVITAETTELQVKTETMFRFALIELGLLTAMVVALVASLLMLRRRQPSAIAEGS